MKTASPTDRFWKRMSAKSTLESEWPTVRFAAIGEAWRLYRQHWKTWSLAMLLAWFGTTIIGGAGAVMLHVTSLGFMGGLLGLGEPRLPLLPTLSMTVVAGFFLGGMVRMAVSQVRGRAPRLEELFSVTDVWFDLLLGSALFGLVLFIGWHLLVIPAFIGTALLMFMYPLVVDARLPATGAMIRSFHALKAQWLAATVVHMAMLALTGLGFAFFGIGLLVTGPLYALSIAVLYREMFFSPTAVGWQKDADPFPEY